MDRDELPYQLNLFTLRLWREVEDGEVIWCGAVKDMRTGEHHTFRGWPMLLRLLPSLLAKPAAE